MRDPPLDPAHLKVVDMASNLQFTWIQQILVKDADYLVYKQDQLNSWILSETFAKTFTSRVLGSRSRHSAWDKPCILTRGRMTYCPVTPMMAARGRENT